jgi:hypothetical protein
MMVGVCVLSSMDVSVSWGQNYLLLVCNPTCACFYCVWKLQVCLVLKILCDMCLSSCMRFMDLMPFVPFRYCVLHVFCVFNHLLFCCVSCLLRKSYFLCGFKVMCHLGYLWLVFYVFNLLLSNLGMWIEGAKGKTS